MSVTPLFKRTINQVRRELEAIESDLAHERSFVADAIDGRKIKTLLDEGAARSRELEQLELVHGETNCARTQRYQCAVCWMHVCWCKGAADLLDRAVQCLGFDGICDSCFVEFDTEDDNYWPALLEVGMRSDLKLGFVLRAVAKAPHLLPSLLELATSHANVVARIDELQRAGGVQ